MENNKRVESSVKSELSIEEVYEMITDSNLKIDSTKELELDSKLNLMFGQWAEADQYDC